MNRKKKRISNALHQHNPFNGTWATAPPKACAEEARALLRVRNVGARGMLSIADPRLHWAHAGAQARAAADAERATATGARQ